MRWNHALDPQACAWSQLWSEGIGRPRKFTEMEAGFGTGGTMIHSAKRYTLA
jgi:tRNA G46 methylase TrmB